MDLVSKTLDKYLRHRFNANTVLDNKETRETRTDQDDMSITLHNISIENLMPCCIAIRDDSNYIAAGFENSHIYLWTFTDQQQQLLADTNQNSSDSHEDGRKSSPKSMFQLLAHSGTVYCVQFVQNKDLMLSCSEDTTIRLWCLKTKCNLTIHRGHNYPVWSISVGPQGHYFASASMDSTARLWRLDKVCPLRIFCGHDEDVECVKFHPNEKYIATGSSDTTVRLWSTSDGKMVRLMVGHKCSITSLSFLPDGKFLASASSDGTIKIWNLATNSVTSEYSVPASHTMSFSPEQRFISSCGADNILRLWQVTRISKSTPSVTTNK